MGKMHFFQRETLKGKGTLVFLKNSDSGDKNRDYRTN